MERCEADGRTVPVPDVVASFQEAVADVLTKAVLACRRHGVADLAVAGGGHGEQPGPLAGRAALRRGRRHAAGDNGAMIAAVGDLLVRSARSPPVWRCPPAPA
ncbi:MAG: hypothetical protein ACRDRH_11395 [Pseudonocardia sp.]